MAPQPAILNRARINNFRLGYMPASLARLRRSRIVVQIAGVNVSARVGSLSIHDIINDTPNTCSFTLNSPAPVGGQFVRIRLNSDSPRDLFTGTIQQDDLSYESKPTHLVYPVRAIDHTVRLTRRRPFGTWVNESVSVIARSIILTYAHGFTSTYVQADLPVTTITFDGTDDFAVCLKRLASAIGGYWYVDYVDVHLFTTESTDLPDPIQSGYPFSDDPPITITTDMSQLRTRQCGKGHGEAVPVDVEAGETIIPIDDQIMFNPLGGRAIAGTTPDGAQSQLLTYTGVQSATTGGTLVGPGVSPSVAPALSLAGGSGLSAGVYQYAYTWVTAAGTTLVSPLATITTGDVTDPTTGPTATADTSTYSLQAGLSSGDTLQFALSFSLDLANTIGVSDLTVGGSIVVPSWAGGSQPASIYYSATFTPPTIARYYHVWVSKNSAAYQREISNVATSGSINPSLVAFFPLGGTPPAVNRSVKQVAISGVGLGPTGTTSRKIYRTVANGVQLKLQQTIANNTATVGVQDATADASLGADAPTADNAGLTSTSGQVNAGSATIPTAGLGAGFPSTGGWIRTSSGELVRYRGISGNTLTGIPASGVGAILTSVLYGSQVLPAPSLTGVTGLEKAMQRGTRVHIWVQRDDLTAQATQAAVDAGNGLSPADGIYEGPPIVDERRGEDSLIALCDATLRLFSTPIVTVVYATRDVKTRSGKPIVVNLSSPAISETLTIQDVTISELGVAPGTMPKFTVTASTWRASLEDLLRRMAASLEPL